MNTESDAGTSISNGLVQVSLHIHLSVHDCEYTKEDLKLQHSV